MLFKVNANRLSVFDPKTDTCIAGFIDGQFETQDTTLIGRLQELGYNPEETIIPIVSETVDDMKPKGKKSKVTK